MHRLFESLRPAIRFIVAHPAAVLLVALLASYIGFSYARQLQVDTDISNLIPSNYESVKALERLEETVGGENEAAVAMTSPSFESNKAYAEALIPAAMQLISKSEKEPFFVRFDYRKDTEFLKDNALYFASTAELDRLTEYLEEKIEDAKLDANPFFFDLEDEDEEAADDSLEQEMQRVYDRIVVSEYPISEDSTTLVVRFYPAGAQTKISYLEDLFGQLDSLAAALGPSGYHPDMAITVAGRLQRQLVEVKTLQDDIREKLGIGVSVVLFLVVLYFFYKSMQAGRQNRTPLLLQLLRLPVLAMIVGLPLTMSLCWTFGVAYLAFEALNLMTSTLGLVLFGLGIDYGIHFYARYTEERARGKTVVDAAETTFVSTGQAITIGALTTAAAMYVLVVADFKGFSEFGFTAGTGILFALIAMIFVMPAIISLFEKLRLVDFGVAESRQFVVTGRKFPAYRGVAIASLLLIVGALTVFPPPFEYRFAELEPTYSEYNERRSVITRVYDNSDRRNPAYIVVDSADEVEQVAAEVRRKIDADTTSPTIKNVDYLQDRFPVRQDKIDEKLERISEIRDLLADPFIEEEESEDLDRLRRASGTTSAISQDQLPEFLKERFLAKTGELGNFVIIYPSIGLSDGRNSIAFSDDIGTVELPSGRVYHAGSTSLVAADMLRLMRSEAPYMVAATFVVIALLMWVNFRSVKWAALALVPLVVGVLWMILLMKVFSLTLNFYNLIVLPAVLGIGNDAGVHMVHRYREEGPGSIVDVLRSTGEHITMGSLTTMMGFAGPLLSFHPGLQSIGRLAIVGIGATLISALVFLPAILQWLEDRHIRQD